MFVLPVVPLPTIATVETLLLTAARLQVAATAEVLLPLLRTAVRLRAATVAEVLLPLLIVARLLQVAVLLPQREVAGLRQAVQATVHDREVAVATRREDKL